MIPIKIDITSKIIALLKDLHIKQTLELILKLLLEYNFGFEILFQKQN